MQPRLIAVSIFVAAAAGRPLGAPADVSSLLARIGERVEQYYARAQSIVCTDTVRLERVTPSFLAGDGHVRELVYELRVSWEPSGEDGAPPDVKVMRELQLVDGHKPKDGDEPECSDPSPIATEPLVMLLPGRQRDFTFAWRGPARVGTHDSMMLDYKPTAKGPERIEFSDNNCVVVELPGRQRGRIWVDAASADVLRLDEELMGTFEFPLPKKYQGSAGALSMTIERADSSIRYQPVTFRDPDETVMLPSAVRTLTVIRNSPSPRMRVSESFTNYRRFMTGARVVKDFAYR